MCIPTSTQVTSPAIRISQLPPGSRSKDSSETPWARHEADSIRAYQGFYASTQLSRFRSKALLADFRHVVSQNAVARNAILQDVKLFLEHVDGGGLHCGRKGAECEKGKTILAEFESAISSEACGNNRKLAR